MVMEKEKLELVLEDVLDELKTMNNAMQEHKQQAVQLKEAFYAYEEKANELKQVSSVSVDIKPIEATINEAMIKIQHDLNQQSRPLIRQWRVLLFPEQYGKEYYKVIFRFIMWMTSVCIGCFLFSLSKQALDDAKEIKLRQLENSQYKNAWNYMYNKESKQGKRKMEDAWQRSWETNRKP
jgi:hypothetical protein